MKRYDIDIEVSRGYGMYDEDEYHDLTTEESKSGKWVLYEDVAKLEKRIKRMQKRIDQLEGRA